MFHSQKLLSANYSVVKNNPAASNISPVKSQMGILIIKVPQTIMGTLQHNVQHNKNICPLQLTYNTTLTCLHQGLFDGSVWSAAFQTLLPANVTVNPTL